MLINVSDIILELHRHFLKNDNTNQELNKASHSSMLSRRLVQDSRAIQQGDIFVALAGHDLDGGRFIPSAIQNGAEAILVDENCQLPEDSPVDANVLIISVPDLRDHLAELCRHFYFGDRTPLPLIGITGTNGKTSISHLLAQLADLARDPSGDYPGDDLSFQSQNQSHNQSQGQGQSHNQSQGATQNQGQNPGLFKLDPSVDSLSNDQKLHKSCAVIGTMGTGHIDNLQPANNTTPGITDVYKLLSEFSVSATPLYRAVAMEVSSHALAQKRVAGVEFETAIFTNLTHEHLDYHGTMEQYFAEKAKLFTEFKPKNAVINVDDEYGLKLTSLLPEQTRLVAFGQSSAVPGFSEYVHIKSVHCHEFGLQLSFEWQLGGLKEETLLNVPLYGEFNAENLAAVFATTLLSGWPVDANAYARLKPVPGRLELFVEDQQPVAIVDYAHTPDALEASLKAVSQHLSGKLHLVFGCGGDRDTSKRPLMAKVAEKYSNSIVVTNDNPRTESQMNIVDDIMAGFSEALIESQNVTVELDRKAAINVALERAKVGDAILIAGKGHEDYQVIGTEKVDYDEREYVGQLMKSRARSNRTAEENL